MYVKERIVAPESATYILANEATPPSADQEKV